MVTTTALDRTREQIARMPNTDHRTATKAFHGLAASIQQELRTAAYEHGGMVRQTVVRIAADSGTSPADRLRLMVLARATTVVRGAAIHSDPPRMAQPRTSGTLLACFANTRRVAIETTALAG